MSTNVHVGISSKAKKVKDIYCGIGNIARKVKKVYVGIGNKAKKSFEGSPNVTNPYGYYTMATSYSLPSTPSIISTIGKNNKYVIVGGGITYTTYDVNMLSTTFTTTTNHADPSPECMSTGEYCIICGGKYQVYSSNGTAINTSLTRTTIDLGTYEHNQSGAGYFSGYGFMFAGIKCFENISPCTKRVTYVNQSLTAASVYTLKYSGSDGGWTIAGDKLLLWPGWDPDCRSISNYRPQPFNNKWVTTGELGYINSKMDQQGIGGTCNKTHGIIRAGSKLASAFNGSLVETTLTHNDTGSSYFGRGLNDKSMAFHFEGSSGSYNYRWTDTLIAYKVELSINTNIRYGGCTTLNNYGFWGGYGSYSSSKSRYALFAIKMS